LQSAATARKRPQQAEAQALLDNPVEERVVQKMVAETTVEEYE